MLSSSFSCLHHAVFFLLAGSLTLSSVRVLSVGCRQSIQLITSLAGNLEHQLARHFQHQLPGLAQTAGTLFGDEPAGMFS